jgi:hypothetical protein
MVTPGKKSGWGGQEGCSFLLERAEGPISSISDSTEGAVYLSFPSFGNIGDNKKPMLQKDAATFFSFLLCAY